jgi:hypothetical protein
MTQTITQPPIVTQKQTQKVKITPYTIQNELTISIDACEKIVAWEIDEIRYSLSSKYWRARARAYKEYQDYREELKKLKALEGKNIDQEKINEQILKVEKAKRAWRDKAVVELTKADNFNKRKKDVQKEQELLIASENILLTPITD